MNQSYERKMIMSNYVDNDPRLDDRASYYKLKFYKRLTSKCGSYEIYRLHFEDEQNHKEFQVQANYNVLKKLVQNILGDNNNV